MVSQVLHVPYGRVDDLVQEKRAIIQHGIPHRRLRRQAARARPVEIVRRELAILGLVGKSVRHREKVCLFRIAAIRRLGTRSRLR